MTKPAILGLTMGDPAGVGPEIVLKVLRDLAPREAAGEFALVVIGTASCMAEAARRLDMPVTISADTGGWPHVRVIEAATTDAPIEPGKLSAEAGRLASPRPWRPTTAAGSRSPSCRRHLRGRR
jgi:4-hydroxythreonine-4-phosphate dehydrogenase